MRRSSIVPIAVIVLSLPACRGAGRSVAPDGRDFPHVAETIDRHAPSMDDLAAFTYSGTDAGTVTLAKGVWRDGPAGDPNVPQVALLKDLRLTGDITGNGTDEAVVLLESRRPPSASRTYLAVVGWIDAQLVNIATTPLSDQVQIKGGHIEPGHIILDAVRRAADGSAAASAPPVQLTYALTGTSLRLTSGDIPPAPAAAVAPPAPALAGTSWTLVQFQSMDDTTLKPEASATYSLSFDPAGTLMVQANCNRGRGTWRSPDNVRLELGPLAMTRASCPSPMNDRFARDLGDIRSYVIKNGQLYLSLQADGGIYEFSPGNRPAVP